MRIKDYKCRDCGKIEFFFSRVSNHIGIYCVNCGAWLKWADKNEQNLALKANKIEPNLVLKHENVLDKIRAEIMQLDYEIECIDFDYNDMPCSEDVHMICREEVLEIIDELKKESEANNGNTTH